MARHRGTGTSNLGSWLNWPWIPGNELHERREQFIRLHKGKFGVMQIVELTGLSWPAVCTAIDLYEAGGLAAIKPKDRGKRSGEGRILAAETVASTVTNKGEARWMIIDGNFNDDRLIEFLDALIKDAAKKVFLI